MEVAHLSAILHDLDDHKYKETKSDKMEAEEFLIEMNYPKDKIKRVIYVIENISFNKQLETLQWDFFTGLTNVDKNMPLELQIAMDADRLDAIGSIGIIRCLEFSRKIGNDVFDSKIPIRNEMSPEQYRSKEKSTAINHMYEKLVHICKIMNTKPAKFIARKREKFLWEFIHNFHDEWNSKFDQKSYLREIFRDE